MKIASVTILCIFLISSCDLLSTRDAEEPSTTRNNFIAATTPDILFSNLTSSFTDKTEENYAACFVDTSFLKKRFLFQPSAGSASQYTVLNEWELDYERQYFRHLSNRTNDSPMILLLTDPEKNITGDSALYKFDYSITLSIDDESIPGSYSGSVLFKIQVDSQQQWVITYWEDIKKGSDPTWSELKGRFYL